MRQFQLMNMPGDYGRITKGDSHREREKLRLGTLLARIESTKADLGEVVAVADVMPNLEEVELKADSLQSVLKEQQMNQQHYNDEFQTLGDKVDAAFKILDQLAPQTRPIDFQTTDAGPGVGILETAVRLRLMESFLLNDLDLQVRALYAPHDSKSHKVKQVMSSLNEACGDGRFITPQQQALLKTWENRSYSV